MSESNPRKTPHGRRPRRGPPIRRSTPAGEHRPVLEREVLQVLDVKPGHAVVDCTLGFAGHSCELLKRVGPDGRLIAFELDPKTLEQARPRLDAIGHPFQLHHGNFAGVSAALAELGVGTVDALVADLGMSSMQVDDSERGFSYRRDGPLDMRMDPTRGKSAAQVLATISAVDLEQALEELGDEPKAKWIARAIVAHRQSTPIERTTQLADLIQKAVGEEDWQLRPKPGEWKIHPAARTFQALRILVNRELNNLRELLRVLPAILAPGGRAAIISFHSGEDRLVKAAFRAGVEQGVYSQCSDDPVRATWTERQSNPRSRSAKLRWAEKAPG